MSLLPKNSIFRRINSWVIVLSLLCALLAVFEIPAANAASSTTTTATASDANPRRGDSVLFSITVTPSSYVAGTPITGNVIISSSKGELCATYALTEDPSSHVVTASCSWIAVSDAGNIKAVYKGSTNYTTSESPNISVSVIEISYFSASRVNEGSSMTIAVGATNAGTLAFKVNGSVIPGCNHESKTVTAGGYANCTYTLPIANSAANGTKTISVDYIPDSKSIMIDAHVSSYTPDKYYLPTTEGMYSSILANFANASSKAPFVSANYVEIDHIFYKLNRSTREALVVGYDRFAGLTELNIPENLDISSIALTAVSAVAYPAKNDFIGTYQVSAIGADAFSMSSASPSTGATLLRSIILPPTVKIIGDRAFKGQCGINQIDIPDSVLAIGTGAFAAMNTTGAITGQGYKMCTVAYSSSNSYSYSASVGSNAHVTYLGHVYSAKQTMSAPSPAPTDSAYWLDLGAQAPVTGLTDVKIGAGVSATGSNPFYAAGNLQKVSFRGAPSDLKAVYEYRRSGLDLWGWTQAVDNWTMRHPISDPTNNTCTNYFVYAGSLEISILASQSLEWQYWAQGCLVAGPGGIKVTLFKPSRPAAPTTETTTRTSSIVRFIAPSSDGGASIQTYSVQFSSTDWATWETFTSTLSSPATPFTVTGLSHTTNYKFRIIATNSVGSSIPSATSAAIKTLSPTVPDAPTIGIATAYDSRTATVTFTAPISDGGSAITGYRATAYPNGETGTVTGSGSGTIFVGGLTTDATDTFTVVAINAVGTSLPSAPSNSVTPLITTVPPVAPVASDAPTGIPPSSIKMMARPKISRSDSYITCNSGEYRFLRNSRSEETLTATSQVVRLLTNGSVVDASTAISQIAQFDRSDAYENSTLSCEVVISLEGITSIQTSLDKETIKLLESEKVKQISLANYEYFKARENAYLNRIEGSASSAAVWKKALEKAISGREAQKVRASNDFIASLEEAGISILYITKAEEITSEPALPVIEKEPPVVNVQPSKAMKKIGTIYFATGTYFITDASKKVIKELALVIANSDPSTLLSYGHTDNKGGTNNLLLSQNRAKAVARLIHSLLPDQKIKTGWYAASKPISSGSSKADLAKNRRVEIYIK